MICVPTSERTRIQAEGWGLRLSTLDETPELDLTVDGADEFDAKLRLIKGGGGALLREKIVAAASKRMVVITDASKEVARLGRFKLPVEADRFGLAATRRHIEEVSRKLGCSGEIALRKAGDQRLCHRRRPRRSSTATSASFPTRTRWRWRSTPFPAWSNTACSSASPAR